jgi:hypothetical protein
MPFIEQLLITLLNQFTTSRHPQRPSDGLRLGTAISVGGQRVDVTIPDTRRPEHAVVLGKTGVGKTHLLELLATQCMERRNGFAFFDFHGDATTHLLAMAATHEAVSERLVIIDPTDPDRSPGLNPLEITDGGDGERFGRVSELSSILRQRWGMDSFGARTEELLRNALFTLAANHLTLVELPVLLTQTDFRNTAVLGVTNDDVRSYWRDRFEPLSEPMKASFREPILNKTTDFIGTPWIRHLIGQPVSTVRLSEAMQTGKWLLINLSKGILREHAHTLANLIFAKLQFDIMARIRHPQSERQLFTIICDEVQNLSENDLVLLLTEGRKFAVSLITANQFWEQLPRSLRGALLATGTQIFFRLSAADARVLGPELSTSGRRYAELLNSLPRGEAIVRIGADAPLHLRIPRLPSPNRQADVERLRSLSATRYTRSRLDIERDIHARRTFTYDREPPNRQTPPTVPTDGGQHDW